MNDIKNIKIAISALPENGWWNEGIVAYQDNDTVTYLLTNSIIFKITIQAYRLSSTYKINVQN